MPLTLDSMTSISTNKSSEITAFGGCGGSSLHPQAASSSELNLSSLDIPVLVEIEQFLIKFPSFSENFLPVSKIGEGCVIFSYP